MRQPGPNVKYLGAFGAWPPARKFEDFRSACFLNLDKMHVLAARFDFIGRRVRFTAYDIGIYHAPRRPYARHNVQRNVERDRHVDFTSQATCILAYSLVFCVSQINIISGRCI